MMTESNTRQKPSYDFSLKEILETINQWYVYLLSHKIKIICAGILGVILGFAYAFLQPVTYNAKTTFVVEDTKSGAGASLGNLASLAGQFGVDLGGSSGSGLLNGDNILLYFKSIKLSREVLLKRIDSNSNKSLADVYAETYELKTKWEKSNEVKKIVNFPPQDFLKKTDRLQDSLLLVMIEEILKKRFSVVRTDKKASFIEVNTSMENEHLAKRYNELLVDAAISSYVNVKTQRQKATLDKLQSRADSIFGLLNRKTAASASLQTSSSTMDINPMYKTGTAVAVETTSRDKTILLTLYAEVVKNLEMAKFTLSQETPVIQVVDTPLLPLVKVKGKKLLTGFFAGLGLSILMIFSLLFRKIIKEA